MKRKKYVLILVVLFLVVGSVTTGVVQAPWSRTPEVISENTARWGNPPSLGVGPDGTVHIAWPEVTNYGGTTDLDIVYKRFEPGLGWTPQVVVSTESTKGSFDPSLGVGPDRKVHIAWVDLSDHAGSGGDYDIFYKRFEPGAGWTSTEVISSESTEHSGSPSLGVGPDGKVHIAWNEVANYAEASADSEIFYKRFEPGIGWTPLEVVSTESIDYPNGHSLGVGSDGTVHIAWIDLHERGVFYRRFEPGSGWTPIEVIATDSPLYSQAPFLGVGPDGMVHIVWRDNSEPYTYDDIFYRRFEPGSGWTPIEVIATEVTDFPYGYSLGVGSDGTVHIAWTDCFNDYGGSGGDYDIVYRRFELGIGWMPAEVVSSESSGDSLYSSLGVGPDGKVHIAWRDNTYCGGGGSAFEVFYKVSTSMYNFIKIVVDNYDEDYSSLVLGVKDPSTGELLWKFDGQFEGRVLEDGRIEYIIPFDVTDVLPSNEEISLLVEATGWSGTITEFSVTCLNVVFTSNDPPVDITSSEPAIASVDFLTPPQVTTSSGTGKAAFFSSSGNIETLSAVDEDTLPQEGRPEGVDFPDGLFSFTINNVVPGETVSVFMELPTPVHIGSKYWKCHVGEDPQWFDLNIGSDDGDDVIFIDVTDGGTGDSDGLADGKIVDPGGSGFMAPEKFLWEIWIIIAAISTAAIIAIGVFLASRGMHKLHSMFTRS